MGHFLLWRLVLGLRFYSFHRLDVYPGSEFISEDQKEKKGVQELNQQESSGNVGMESLIAQ